MPRFKEGNFERNVELVSKLKDMAAKKGITASQLALAWVHAQVKPILCDAASLDCFQFQSTMQQLIDCLPTIALTLVLLEKPDINGSKEGRFST